MLFGLLKFNREWMTSERANRRFLVSSIVGCLWIISAIWMSFNPIVGGFLDRSETSRILFLIVFLYGMSNALYITLGMLWYCWRVDPSKLLVRSVKMTLLFLTEPLGPTVYYLLTYRPQIIQLGVASLITGEGGARTTKRARKLYLSFIIFLAICACIGMLFYVEGRIKSSHIYQLSVERALSFPGVLDNLGQPVQEGWFVIGSISQNEDGTGQASLKIPLVGPKGKGMLHVEAGRQSGDWQLSDLELTVEGQGSQIDLLKDERH